MLYTYINVARPCCLCSLRQQHYLYGIPALSIPACSVILILGFYWNMLAVLFLTCTMCLNFTPASVHSSCAGRFCCACTPSPSSSRPPTSTRCPSRAWLSDWPPDCGGRSTCTTWAHCCRSCGEQAGQWQWGGGSRWVRTSTSAFSTEVLIIDTKILRI